MFLVEGMEEAVVDDSIAGDGRRQSGVLEAPPPFSRDHLWKLRTSHWHVTRGEFCSGDAAAAER